MMKLKLTLLFILPFIGFGQTSNVEIFNAYAIPDYTYTLTDSIDSIVTISVNFKINNLSNADKIYINIGSSLGANDTQALIYEVQLISGKPKLVNMSNNQSKLIYGKKVSLQFLVNENALSTFKYIEVYGLDKSGVLIAKKNIQL